MRLMWTSLVLWNHPTDGFEYKKLEQVSNCKLGLKNSNSLKSELRKGVDLGSKIKDVVFPDLLLEGELFYHSMLCMWTTSLAYFTWLICQLKLSFMQILVVSCL